MKKIFRLLGIAVLAVTVCTVFLVGCLRDSEKVDNGIKITFVTGCVPELEPIITTLKKPASLPEDPYKPGYSFTGWYYDAECTKKFSTSDGLKTDTTLYAGWEEKQAHISGDGSGGTIVTDSAGFMYTKIDNGYSVVGYSGTSTEVFIPASFEGVAVKEIGQNAFSSCDMLTKITVSSVIENIHNTAFKGAFALKYLAVSVDNKFFASKNGVIFDKGFTKLIAVPSKIDVDSYVIPSDVGVINANAFSGCKCEVILNGKMTTLQEYSFAGFGGKIEITSGITEIRKGAFSGATCEITFAKDCSLTKLVNGEFDGYGGEKLVIPGKIAEISGGAFAGCTAELDLTLTGMKKLGDMAFYKYAGEKLVIPYSVEELGENCFTESTALVTFDPNSAIAEIGTLAFNQFKGEVVFPKTVKTVKENAFYALGSTAKITFGAKQIEMNVDERAFYLSKALSENIIYGAE